MCTLFRHCGSFLVPAVFQVCLMTQAGNPGWAEGWPRVAVKDPLTRAAVQASLDGAVQWLAQVSCQAVLTDFHDEQGCPLAKKLEKLGMSFETYLQRIVVHDASGTRMCRDPNQFAFTAPGSRVVFVCGRAFQKTWNREPSRAKAILIHEVLHTLGLGENAPFATSREITRMVLARCEP